MGGNCGSSGTAFEIIVWTAGEFPAVFDDGGCIRPLLAHLASLLEKEASAALAATARTVDEEAVSQLLNYLIDFECSAALTYATDIVNGRRNPEMVFPIFERSIALIPLAGEAAIIRPRFRCGRIFSISF
jgi:hypothetical protein